MPAGTALRTTVEDAFRKAGLRFQPAIEGSHHQTLFSLVSAGLGITLLPRLSVPAGRQRRCKIIELVKPGIQREICVITLREKKLRSAAAQLAEMISQALQEAQ